ncbi:hypothetical protein [Bradyrhizobium ottawaense]|uniref:hypothetical protein n=1 Tax=Bradyrhizobium ottawaense TaxID=931866 RepID=UPI003F9FFD14
MKRESSMADIVAADARALFGDVRPALAGIDEQDASHERGSKTQLSGERTLRAAKSGKVQSAG